MRRKLGDAALPAPTLTRSSTTPSSAAKRRTWCCPIALANLVLHGIDQPNLWHGNTLTRVATYDALFDGRLQFDVILTNPPFGGKEGQGRAEELRLRDQRHPGAVRAGHPG
jgi:type I restriction enzyme M protein